MHGRNDRQGENSHLNLDAVRTGSGVEVDLGFGRVVLCASVCHWPQGSRVLCSLRDW